mgnify:CR=1 FL=1
MTKKKFDLKLGAVMGIVAIIFLINLSKLSNLSLSILVLSSFSIKSLIIRLIIYYRNDYALFTSF